MLIAGGNERSSRASSARAASTYSRCSSSEISGGNRARFRETGEQDRADTPTIPTQRPSLASCPVHLLSASVFVRVQGTGYMTHVVHRKALPPSWRPEKRQTSPETAQDITRLRINPRPSTCADLSPISRLAGSRCSTQLDGEAPLRTNTEQSWRAHEGPKTHREA